MSKRAVTTPVPLVSIGGIERLLLRHIGAAPSGPLPEQRLAVAVICQAILDCRSRYEGERQGARRFILGDDMAAWARWVELEPAFVREVAEKTLYLIPNDGRPTAESEPESGQPRRRRRR